MLLKEIAIAESIPVDAEDELFNLERGLASLIKAQQGTRPLPLDVFFATLDRRAYATRKLMVRFGVEFEKARELINSVVSKHQEEINKAVQISSQKEAES